MESAKSTTSWKFDPTKIRTPISFTRFISALKVLDPSVSTCSNMLINYRPVRGPQGIYLPFTNKANEGHFMLAVDGVVFDSFGRTVWDQSFAEGMNFGQYPTWFAAKWDLENNPKFPMWCWQHPDSATCGLWCIYMLCCYKYKLNPQKTLMLEPQNWNGYESQLAKSFKPEQLAKLQNNDRNIVAFVEGLFNQQIFNGSDPIQNHAWKQIPHLDEMGRVFSAYLREPTVPNSPLWQAF